MEEKIKGLEEEINNFSAKTSDEIEQFRIKYLGKKGIVTALFEEFKTLPTEQRKEVGRFLNILKTNVQEKINTLKSSLEQTEEKIEN